MASHSRLSFMLVRYKISGEWLREIPLVKKGLRALTIFSSSPYYISLYVWWLHSLRLISLHIPCWIIQPWWRPRALSQPSHLPVTYGEASPSFKSMAILVWHFQSFHDRGESDTSLTATVWSHWFQLKQWRVYSSIDQDVYNLAWNTIATPKVRQFRMCDDVAAIITSGAN